jgi:hypothetical protein
MHKKPKKKKQHIAIPSKNSATINKKVKSDPQQRGKQN